MRSVVRENQSQLRGNPKSQMSLRTSSQGSSPMPPGERRQQPPLEEGTQVRAGGDWLRESLGVSLARVPTCRRDLCSVAPSSSEQWRFSEIQKEGRDSCIPGRKTCPGKWTARQTPARDTGVGADHSEHLRLGSRLLDAFPRPYLTQTAEKARGPEIPGPRGSACEGETDPARPPTPTPAPRQPEMKFQLTSEILAQLGPAQGRSSLPCTVTRARPPPPALLVAGHFCPFSLFSASPVPAFPPRSPQLLLNGTQEGLLCFSCCQVPGQREGCVLSSRTCPHPPGPSGPGSPPASLPAAHPALSQLVPLISGPLEVLPLAPPSGLRATWAPMKRPRFEEGAEGRDGPEAPADHQLLRLPPASSPSCPQHAPSQATGPVWPSSPSGSPSSLPAWCHSLSFWGVAGRTLQWCRPPKHTSSLSPLFQSFQSQPPEPEAKEKALSFQQVVKGSNAGHPQGPPAASQKPVEAPRLCMDSRALLSPGAPGPASLGQASPQSVYKITLGLIWAP